jgi:hypothetical protein
MTHHSDGALAALAKDHLSFSSSTPVSLILLFRACRNRELRVFFSQDDHVPRFYVEELRRHIVLYPTEDQVRLTTVKDTRCLIRPTRF